jgi:ketosteroid isomerase-like protein
MADDTTVRRTDVFRELASRLDNREWERAAELYAEDVVVTNPFAAEGPTTSTGRDAVRQFFVGLGSQLDTLAITDPTLTDGADPEVLVAEFSFSATAGGGSVAFTLPAMFVLRVRDGQIISSRDYIGPRRATPATTA